MNIYKFGNYGSSHLFRKAWSYS